MGGSRYTNLYTDYILNSTLSLNSITILSSVLSPI